MNEGTELNNNHTVKGGGFFALYIALVMAVYILPAVKIYVPYAYAGLLMLVFLPYAMFKLRLRAHYYVLLFCTSGLVFFVDQFNGLLGPIGSLNEMIRNLRFYLPAIWMVYAFRFCSLKWQRLMLFVFTVIVIYILVKTFIALGQNEMICRILAGGKGADSFRVRAYRLGNVGGFEFSYMMGIVTIALVWAGLKIRRKFRKLLCLAAAGLSFFFIIKTMYTTLLLLTVGGIILLFVFRTKVLFIRALWVIGGTVAAILLPPLLAYVAELYGKGSFMAQKFMGMYKALVGGDADAASSRPEHALTALHNWIESPLWGGYAINPATHSLAINLLERTGIIGFLAFVACMTATYKLIIAELKKRGIETLLFSVVFWYVLVLSVLNPIGNSFEVVIAAFFLTPIWIRMICGEASLRSLSSAR